MIDCTKCSVSNCQFNILAPKTSCDMYRPKEIYKLLENMTDEQKQKFEELRKNFEGISESEKMMFLLVYVFMGKELGGKNDN